MANCLLQDGWFSGDRCWLVLSDRRHLPNGATDLIAWAKDLSSPLDDGTPVVSDAPFVWLRRDASGRPAKGFLLDGSHLEWERRPLHDGPRRESRLLVFD
jgi:hypothetical protein